MSLYLTRSLMDRRSDFSELPHCDVIADTEERHGPILACSLDGRYFMGVEDWNGAYHVESFWPEQVTIEQAS